LNELEIADCPAKKGKINAAKFYIKESYSNNFSSIAYYKDLLSNLRLLIRHSALYQFEKDFSLDSCTDFNGLALKIIYIIRNKLAHGDYNFPEPTDWYSHLPLEPEISRISTRLIIITMQMIMIAQNNGSFENLDFHDSEILQKNEDGISEINELDYLKCLHVINKAQNRNKSQLDLF
jgi:hypothetical protein